MSDTIVMSPQTTPNMGNTPRQFLRLPEVLSLLGVSRVTIWRMVKQGDFPPPVKLGKTRLIAWFADDIYQWQENLTPTYSL